MKAIRIIVVFLIGVCVWVLGVFVVPLFLSWIILHFFSFMDSLPGLIFFALLFIAGLVFMIWSGRNNRWFNRLGGNLLDWARKGEESSDSRTESVRIRRVSIEEINREKKNQRLALILALVILGLIAAAGVFFFRGESGVVETPSLSSPSDSLEEDSKPLSGDQDESTSDFSISSSVDSIPAPAVIRIDTISVGDEWKRWEIPPRHQFRFLVEEGDTLEIILGNKNGQKIQNVVADSETKLPPIPGPPYIVWLRSQNGQDIQIEFLYRSSSKVRP
ncbi:MAG: hypothetical protein Q8L36_01040 [bacterium]|nr:hypothetical protein [bacterium]